MGMYHWSQPADWPDYLPSICRDKPTDTDLTVKGLFEIYARNSIAAGVCRTDRKCTVIRFVVCTARRVWRDWHECQPYHWRWQLADGGSGDFIPDDSMPGIDVILLISALSRRGRTAWPSGDDAMKTTLALYPICGRVCVVRSTAALSPWRWLRRSRRERQQGHPADRNELLRQRQFFGGDGRVAHSIPIRGLTFAARRHGAAYRRA